MPGFLPVYIGCEEEHTVGYSANVNLYGLDSLLYTDSVLGFTLRDGRDMIYSARKVQGVSDQH